MGKETKGQFESRLKECGCWEHYKDVREGLKAEQRALPESERLSDQAIVGNLRESPQFASGNCCRFRKSGAEFSLGAVFEGGSGDLGPSVSLPSVSSGSGSGWLGKSGSGSSLYENSTSISSLTEEVFDGARGNKSSQPMRVVVEWVFEVLEDDGYPSGSLKTLEAAPSMGAFGLLKWARHSPNNKAEFYRSFVAKLLPSKSEIDAGLDFGDDGREAFARLDAFEAAVSRGELEAAG